MRRRGHIAVPAHRVTRPIGIMAERCQLQPPAAHCRILGHAIHALGRRHARLLIRNRAPHRPVARRLLPRHVVDLARRPQILRRIAMAVQAPLHLQRVLRIHQRHLVHAPMAGGAANPLVHVNRVVEENKIRQVVHLDPRNRLARSPSSTRTGSSSCALVQICAWQLMQVLVGGMPA